MEPLCEEPHHRWHATCYVVGTCVLDQALLALERRLRTVKPNSILNCWEFQGCGREPGGDRAGERGPCPASTEAALDGAHGGANGGRSCWTIDDTLCGGEPSGAHEHKIHECRKCAFHLRVQVEQGMKLLSDTELLTRVRATRSK